MKESLNETLIPCLVIKTSWHKLSKVLGHGGSSFYLQGSKKCSDWLSLSRKTHTPGKTHIDYLSKFLSAASSRPGCSDASTSTLSSAICSAEPIQHGGKAFSFHRWQKRIRQNGKESHQKCEIKAINCIKTKWPGPDLVEHIHLPPWHYQDSHMWMQFLSLFRRLSCFSVAYIGFQTIKVYRDNHSFNEMDGSGDLGETPLTARCTQTVGAHWSFM